MNNNIKRIKQELKSYAKRCKNIKFTESLLFIFLMTGLLVSASAIKADKGVETARKEINTSIDDIKGLFRQAKAENNRLLKNSNLELIQLMEQGDQVVKSPWSSWQFGMNFYYDQWNGTYKGRGDKAEKYPYEGIYRRSNDLFLRSVSPYSRNYGRYVNSITENPLHSATTSESGLSNPSWGIESSVFDQEPILTLNLLATVRPKEINKTAPTVNLGTIQGPGSITFSITPPAVEIKTPEMKEIVFNPVRPIEPTKPVFTPHTLKIEAFNSTRDANALTPAVENGGSFKGNSATIATTEDLKYSGVTPEATTKKIVAAPAVFGTRNFYGNDGAAFKTYFDVNGTETFSESVVIDSVGQSSLHTVSTTGNTLDNQTAPSGKRTFLVGGSRVGTLDNGAGTLTSTGTVDLAGVLVAGFVAETSGTSGGGDRKIVNTGTITDEVETTHYQDSNGLGGLLSLVTDQNGVVRYSDGSDNSDNGAKASTTLNLPGYSEMGSSISITRTPGTGTWDSVNKKWTKRAGGGYVGYKIGLLLAHEDPDATNTYTLENGGTIKFSGTNSIGIQIEADGSSTTKVNALNKKDITLGGANSYGMKLSSRVDSTSTVKNEGTITMNGGNSAGIAVIEETDSAGDSSGTNDTVRAHTGKVVNSGTIDVKGNQSVGMYLKLDAADDITNTGTINVGNVTRGVGMWVIKGSVGTDASGTPKAYNDKTITLSNAGTLATAHDKGGSIGMVAEGVATAENRSGGTIDLTNTKGYSTGGNTPTWYSSAGMYSTGAGATITNNGTIKGTGNSRAVGMVVDAGTTGTNNTSTGKINITGSTVGGVYNKGTFTNTGDITMTGSGAAVYSNGAASTTTISSGNISVTGGGTSTSGNTTTSSGMIAFYADGSSTMTLGSPIVTVNKNGLLLYNAPSNSVGAQANKFNLTGTTNATINEGGLAFHFANVGTTADLKTAVDNLFTTTSTGKIVLTLKDGAHLFTLKNSGFSAGTAIKTSDFGSYTPGNPVSLGNTGKVEISASSGKYKIMSLKGGKLEIDTATDLNDTSAIYNRIDKESSSIKLSGVAITDAANAKGRSAIAQRNTISTLASDMVLENAGGTITLGGEQATGIAAETGTVTNNGTITLTGPSSTGLYGADGSIITNDSNGKITVGTKGAGILAQNDLDGTMKTTGLITVENKGNIAAAAGSTAVIGIHADNANGPATSTVKHTSGSIDLSQATKSLGIYTNNLELTSAADIKVTGTGSAGIQAKNSKVDVTGGTIEVGNEGIGVILENHGAKNFNGTGGTISINGTDSVGYYILNSTTNATNFVDNLTLNPNNNKYTYIYAKGSTLNYENTKTIDTDGSVFINAENSSVTLGANNSITSPKNNVVALYLKDSSGKTATNKGTIDLSGDKAVAMYGEGGGEILNEKDIKVGSNGVGLYNKTGSTAKNASTGKIVLDGDYGIGMRSDNASAAATSTNEGAIESSKLRAVGMSASDGSNALINASTGKIELTGQESIGMHTDNLGTAGHEIRNEGIIKLVDATDETKPNIGIYSDNSADRIINNKDIETGNQTIGIYSRGGGNVTLGGTSKTTVGQNAMGIYTTGGTVTIHDGAAITVGDRMSAGKESVGVFYAGSKGTINNNTANITIGEGSIGFVMKGGSGNTLNSLNPSNGTVTLKKESVFIYDDTQSTVKNHTNLKSSAATDERIYGIYTNGKGENYGSIDFSLGKGNVGIYSYLYDPNYMNNVNAKGEYIAKNTPGAFANYGTITVSESDIRPQKLEDKKYGIGMAAGYVRQRLVNNPVTNQTEIKRDVLGLGNIENHGTIKVTTPNSIGMYAGGKGSKAINHRKGVIELSGTELNVGMFLEDGAEGHNYGTITTVGSGNKEQVGIAVMREATLHNHPGGKIYINAEDGIGIAIAGKVTLVNRGEFVISGDQKTASINGDAEAVKAEGDNAVAVAVISDGSKIMGVSPVNQVGIIHNDGTYDATITYNGVPVPYVHTVNSIPSLNPGSGTIQTSSIGIYLDTSGVNATKPINGIGNLATGMGLKYVDLIVGTEATQHTNEKYLKLSKELINPYNNMILEAQSHGLRRWQIYSNSLTWMAKAEQNTDTQVIENMYLVKVPYTVWSGKLQTPVNSSDTYNFLDGLDQRYGVEAIGTREREVFTKLNSIGNNEHILLVQAFDEMMGHQYGNTQQRMAATGAILDKEFKHLKKEWENKSKQSNKIKTFGSRGEYRTDTAGIIDYTNNAYGVAYVHEDETIKLGNSTGWYAGAVYNQFRLKDIGKSRENTTMLKAGVFKSTAFDHNGSLKWTISGEGYISRSEMDRRFLVVDDIFSAQSTYYTYGVGLKNELSKEFRTSERTSITPYGSLKLEYGRFNGIKEDTGEIRLEIESNSYHSIKPELGIEFKYQQPMAQRTKLITTLGLAYETELGKVGDVGNRGRVRYTNADWFGIRSEKDDRKGNFKADLNLGIENQRVGFTLNLGYDTKGENFRGGLGIRAIY